jgi:DNA topoisomerase I
MARQWILRRGTPHSGLRYVRENGSAVRERRVLERIEALRIPPAWRDVHIAVDPRAAIQAWGFDARGRRQYRYHERAIERGTLRKYHRVREMALGLPRIRRTLHEDAARPGFGLEKVCALVVLLISEGFFRVGGERYTRENRTFGITTLRKSHVRVHGSCLEFDYRGKGSIDQHQVIVDGGLARAVRRLLGSPGPRLFRWRDREGWHDITARDVNCYLHDRIGVRYTAKDFRTWGGTLRLATVLAEIGPAASPTEAKRNVALGVRLVAAELGNTPAICRASYVHPIIIARYLDAGDTIALGRPGARRRGSFDYAPEERALIRFLGRWFPDRRASRREETGDRAAA